jgi:hypothetical protein
MELSSRVVKHLEKAELQNAGQIHERLSLGDEAMLAVEGIGPKALAEIKQAIETKGLGLLPLAEPAPAIEEAQAEVAPEIVEAQPEAAPVTEAPAAPVEAQSEAALAPAVEAPAAAIPDLGALVLEEEEEEEEEIESATGKKKAKKKAKRKDRKLVFDEALGEVVAVKERKSGRKGEVWEEDV